jgi:uncharacterized cupin superfamily protein
MGKAKVTQFRPNGPDDGGLTEWDPIDPGGLEAGAPLQRGHIYHEEATFGYLAGVWDCTPMTENFGPYPVHEFMFLLEGSVTMVLADGIEITVNAGQPFLIPKGLPCQWKQLGYVRKYFMIFENPTAQAVEDVSSQSIILPHPSGPPGGMAKIEIDDPSGYIGDLPTQHNHTYFEDPSAQFIAGVRDSTPYECSATQFSRNELIYLLEGALTLTDDAGQAHHFVAGDAVYVPKGTVCGWKSTGYVRMFYSIFQPLADADAGTDGKSSPGIID